MADAFPLGGAFEDRVSEPSRRGVAITPDNATPLTDVPKALLVGVAGNITGRQVDDTGDVVYPVQAGYNPLRMVLVKATGTTATGIVALY